MHLTTVDSVIEALGGVGRVKALTGVKTIQVIWDWKKRECFPPKFFLVMTYALQAKDMSAPVSLWQMVEPRREQAAL